MIEDIAGDVPGNLDDVHVADRRHPCSKIIVRVVTVITCIHMIIHRRVTPAQDGIIRCRTFSFIHGCPAGHGTADFDDPDATDIANFVVRWVMFGSFPMLSLVAVLISGPVMGQWPRLVERFFFSPTLMHIFCLFSLVSPQFYMFLESLFRSFAFIYGISSTETGNMAPWSEYLMASLYSILLWFFFLNFLVNIQLTEFDCRNARERNLARNRNDQQ